MCVCRVLGGAEALWVARELIDSCSMLGDDDSGAGLSLLDASQYQSLLRCLSSWQRQYSRRSNDVTLHRSSRQVHSLHVSDVNMEFFTNPDIETLNPVKIQILVHHRLYRPTTVAGLITG